MNWLDEVKWDRDGLVPVIAQEAGSGDVLMFAFMNREALQLTAERVVQRTQSAHAATLQLDAWTDALLEKRRWLRARGHVAEAGK